MNLRCNEDGFKTEMSLVFTENAACKLRFSGFHHSIGSNYNVEQSVGPLGHSSNEKTTKRRLMQVKKASVHAQSTTLFNIPPAFCEGGPLFRLGTVSFSPNIWEVVPAMFLARALDLHSCGIFGDLEAYEIDSNFANISRLEKFYQGSEIYIGAIFSRWSPPGHPPFNVSTYCFSSLYTDVVARPN